jgi:hypothetical protein
MIEMCYGIVKLEKYVSWNILQDIVQKMCSKNKSINFYSVYEYKHKSLWTSLQQCVP